MCATCGIPTHIAPDAISIGSSESGTQLARFVALRHPHFRVYVSGAMLSMMADNVEHVITYWVLYQTFHSPALAGFAVISHWVPFLAFSVYFGGLADRHDCRKVIQISQLLYMSVSAIWGVLFLTNSLQVWHAVILLSVHGMAGALWAPGEQLMLHDIVGARELPSAIRLNSTARSLGVLAGPAVGSALLLGLGATYGIFANVLLYAPLTVWLLRAPYTGHVRDTAAHVVRPGRIKPSDIIAVLREVRGMPVIVSMIALGGMSSLFIGNALQSQMPEFAHHLDVNQAGVAYGALLAANAAGAVLGGFLLESTRILKGNPRGAMLSTSVWALCMLGFALSTSYALSLALLLMAGVANLASQSISQTLVQLLAPAEKRGRVVGAYGMGVSGLRAGSGVSVGLVGTVTGIHWSLGLSAVALLFGVAILMTYVSRARPAVVVSRSGVLANAP